MDWSKIRRRTTEADLPAGVYASLEELVRIRYRARDFSFKPQQPVTSILSGRYASRLRGRGLNFEELRRYHEGDDIRTIDWHVTARTRTPYVRVYTEEKDRGVLLVVDAIQGPNQRLPQPRPLLLKLAPDLSDEDAHAVLAGNAARVYGFEL